MLSWRYPITVKDFYCLLLFLISVFDFWFHRCKCKSYVWVWLLHVGADSGTGRLSLGPILCWCYIPSHQRNTAPSTTLQSRHHRRLCGKYIVGKPNHSVLVLYTQPPAQHCTIHNTVVLSSPATLRQIYCRQTKPFCACVIYTATSATLHHPQHCSLDFTGDSVANNFSANQTILCWCYIPSHQCNTAPSQHCSLVITGDSAANILSVNQTIVCLCYIPRHQRNTAPSTTLKSRHHRQLCLKMNCP